MAEPEVKLVIWNHEVLERRYLAFEEAPPRSPRREATWTWAVVTGIASFLFFMLRLQNRTGDTGLFLPLLVWLPYPVLVGGWKRGESCQLHLSSQCFVPQDGVGLDGGATGICSTGIWDILQHLLQQGQMTTVSQHRLPGLFSLVPGKSLSMGMKVTEKDHTCLGPVYCCQI